MISYISLFFIYAFIGWILDTCYRSVVDGKYSSGTALPFLSLIYGFGGLFLTIFFRYLPLPIFFHILLGTLLVILVEFSGGLFCLHVLKKRYWDYSQEAGNFLGHIDIIHSIYWFLLVIFFRLLFPFFFSH
ncbi:hypothetical protein EXS74_02875 [Candidatus Woesearchaeota archaeon]|nr:hypothetical protein [Candidatus Woesearchaeota archaeon]